MSVSACVPASHHHQSYLRLVSRLEIRPDEIQILLVQFLFGLAVLALLPSPASGAVLDFVLVFILVGDETFPLLHRN